MRRLEKPLFVYSIVAVTALLITFGLYSPTPGNLISALLLTPLFFYFWLRTTSPQGTSMGQWSIRLLVIIIVLSALGVYGGFLSKYVSSPAEKERVERERQEAQETIDSLNLQVENLKQDNVDNNALKQDLGDIKDELARLSAEGKLVLGSNQSNIISSLLTDPDEQTTVGEGYVTIKSSLIQELDVMQDPSFSAAVVGTITYGTNYYYTETDSGWYKIKLPKDIYGWVHESDVKEVTGT